jgi:hypothetical protein
VQGVGATRDGNVVRVGVLHVADHIRKGRLKLFLTDSAGSDRVTVLVPERVPAGDYQRVTLEVAE